MKKLTQDYFDKELSLQGKSPSVSTGKRVGKYFLPTQDSIGDGVDVTFLTDIIEIEYGTEQLDGREYPNPDKEGQGLDNGGNPHSIFQCEIMARGGWDSYGEAPFNHTAYMTFWFTKDPNNVWYPSLNILVTACNNEGIDIDEIKNTIWHIETRDRPDSEWKDVIWTYKGNASKQIDIPKEKYDMAVGIVDEVTKNGAVACGEPSLRLRLSKNGFVTKEEQTQVLSKLEENGEISISNNQIRKIKK